MDKTTLAQQKNATSDNLPKYYVAMGASAGGLEALSLIFDHVPNDHVAYIVIQHLSPNTKSLIKELLEKHTTLKIKVAKNKMLIEKNHVYVIPAGKDILIEQGKFIVVDRPEGPHYPIDIFMSSLAEDQGKKSIGVILSGTGSDGTKGIQEIKNAGGLILVQDPVSAKFDGMVKSAILTGIVDIITMPELIPEEINAYVQNPSFINFYKEALEGKNETYLINILNIIRNITSRDFSDYKRATILRRLKRRMLYHNITDLAVYSDFLTRNPEEVSILCKDFLINVTKFFRDPEAFEEVSKNVIPAIFKNRPASDPVKIWVAGCCTGEEAYSIAILISEHLKDIKKEYDVKIFASDIDKQALEFAGRGIFSKHILNDISQERLERFFIKDGNHYKILPRIRKMIIFAQHDVISDPPFGKIDLLSCRNLLIYLNADLQQKLLATFHSALNKGGFLFLGSSESKGDLKNLVEDVNSKWKIYKSTGSTGSVRYTPKLSPQRELIPLSMKESNSIAKSSITDLFTDFILEEQEAAGVCIDESHEIVKAWGDFKKFLHLPEKMLNFNLLKMVPDELSIALGTGIQKTLKSNSRLTIKGIKIREKNALRTISIVLKPLVSKDTGRSKMLLILFNEDRAEKLSTKNQEVFDKEKYFNARLSDLDQELRFTKDSLQNTIEELETSNEELQSANEELLSANEELQSTNEELQSLNEELITLNAEHARKINELVDLNDDLNNYFRATDISHIFVDRNLIIRKFTPASKIQINLIESDMGRPFNHISNNIMGETLIEDIKAVINNSISLEKNVRTKDSRWYQMKIQPYLRQDKIIDGAIITFIDITEDLLKSEKEIEFKIKQQRDIVNAVIETQETERKRIGESLHNGLGQLLYAVKLKQESIENERDKDVLNNLNSEVQQLLTEAINETRSLSTQLMPSILDHYGLETAINDICGKLKNDFKLKCNVKGFEKRLEGSTEIAIFRIVQELVNNIVKHSKATAATIELINKKGNISLRIKDNGKGFNPDGKNINGIGLSSIRNRVKFLNGQMTINSKKGETAIAIDFSI